MQNINTIHAHICTCSCKCITPEQKEAIHQQAKDLYVKGNSYAANTIEILEQLLMGKPVKVIAQELGLTKARIYQARDHFMKEANQ